MGFTQKKGRKGWFKERKRHSLARRGIKTTPLEEEHPVRQRQILKYSSRPDFRRKFGDAEYVGTIKGKAVWYHRGKLFAREESIAGSWGKMVEVFPEEVTTWRETKVAYEARVQQGRVEQVGEYVIKDRVVYHKACGGQIMIDAIGHKQIPTGFGFRNNKFVIDTKRYNFYRGECLECGTRGHFFEGY